MAAWAYHQEHPSSWAPFSGNESSQLEAAFDDQATTECELQGSDWRRWRVDQVRMKLLCVTSGTTRAICRRKYPSADAARWEWQGDAGWQRYDPYVEGQLGAAQAAGRRVTTIFLLSYDAATPYRITWSSCAGGGDGTQCNTVYSRAEAPGATQRIRWGCPRREALHFRAQPLDTAQLAHLTGWSVLRPGEWEAGAGDPIMHTALGEGGEAVVRLPCHSAAISCTFNLSTIEQALRLRPVCPACSQAYGALPGVQPSGTMQFGTDTASCTGHSPCPTIVISYDFPGGTQGPRDPAPGMRYDGAHRTCYYPDSPLGWSCVNLLRLAFERGQLFRIGRSVTSGRDNVVVWGGIHQKTAKHGGAVAHGWPDETHLQRLQSEAACKGIAL